MDNKTAGLSIVCVVLAMFLVFSFVTNAPIQDNYDQGVADGYKRGTNDGYNDGYRTGNQTGYFLGHGIGNQTGYDAGYIQGTKDGAGTGYNIRDPTYTEMMAFIAQDQTHKNTYHKDNYNCYDFTNDFCNNAFDQGLRAGYVYIKFPDSAHAIACFKTVDRGIVFIEPQHNKIVNVEVGINYSSSNPNFAAPTYDDTIVQYKIIW